MEYADVFKKYDDEKVMYSLIDTDFHKEFAEVLTHGAKKYGIDNWKLLDLEKEDGTRRYIDALLRHIEAYRSGEKIDPETNLSHLAHACCNLMFLHWFDAKAKKEDIRLSNLPKPKEESKLGPRDLTEDALRLAVIEHYSLPKKYPSRLDELCLKALMEAVVEKNDWLTKEEKKRLFKKVEKEMDDEPDSFENFKKSFMSQAVNDDNTSMEETIGFLNDMAERMKEAREEDNPKTLHVDADEFEALRHSMRETDNILKENEDVPTMALSEEGWKRMQELCRQADSHITPGDLAHFDVEVSKPRNEEGKLDGILSSFFGKNKSER